MNNKARNTITEHNMLKKGDTVIAAVSGGADSMALIRFLLEIKDEFSLNLAVCHINHLLRGSEADRDEDFVRNFCEKNSIPFHLLRCNVLKLATEQKIGFEECGRLVRYNFFKQTSEKLGGAKIATAHTLSDRCETLLFNISRGCGVSGLCSIAPVRDNIIRPLIDCTRAEIEEYLLRLSQSYVTDSTNSDTDYTRNFIRNEIIPKFKKLNSSFEIAVLNLLNNCKADSDLISDLTKEAVSKCVKNKKIEIKAFLSYQKAIQSGIILHLFRENNIEFSKKRCDSVLELINMEGSKISVCKNGYIVNRDGFIYFEKKPKEEKNDISFCLPFYLGKTALPNGRILKISIITRSEFENIKKNFKNLLKNCIDCDIIDAEFVTRTRKEGDFITLFPRNVTKTLKKLLNESKTPTEKRDIIPLIAKGSRVIWAEGLGIDESAAVSDLCENILFIEVLEDNKENGEDKNAK